MSTLQSINEEKDSHRLKFIDFRHINLKMYVKKKKLRTLKAQHCTIVRFEFRIINWILSLKFQILYALQYNTEFHYLYFPPEKPPATHSVGEFGVRHEVVPYGSSYGVEFLPIVWQASTYSR